MQDMRISEEELQTLETMILHGDSDVFNLGMLIIQTNYMGNTDVARMLRSILNHPSRLKAPFSYGQVNSLANRIWSR